MTARRLFFAGLVLVSLVAGWHADRPAPRAPIVLGGYEVLAADFHTHSSMFSNGTFTPWGLVLEARRGGLDVLAITGHGAVVDAKVGRWAAQFIAGAPVVLVGEEVQTVDTHLIAVGIENWISGWQPVSDQIDEAHAQGGVAIAAHPLRVFWPGFDDQAVSKLDGTEVCHPDIYTKRPAKAEFERFAARAQKTAIGSSDFHGFGRIGACRTYVFVKERTVAAVLDAVRSGRTVVYGAGGQAYGAPDLIALADTRPELREEAAPWFSSGPGDWPAFLVGLAGLAGLLFLSDPRSSDTPSRSEASNHR